MQALDNFTDNNINEISALKSGPGGKCEHTYLTQGQVCLKCGHQQSSKNSNLQGYRAGSQANKPPTNMKGKNLRNKGLSPNPTSHL